MQLFLVPHSFFTFCNWRRPIGQVQALLRCSKWSQVSVTWNKTHILLGLERDPLAKEGRLETQMPGSYLEVLEYLGWEES